LKNLNINIFSILIIGFVYGNPIETDYNLPDNFPEINITIVDNPDSGYLFLCAYLMSSTPFSLGNYMMILNNDGSPVFFKEMQYKALDFKVQSSDLLSFIGKNDNNYHCGTVYLMDTTYAVVDTFRIQGYCTDRHDVQVLPNGNVLLLGKITQQVNMSHIVLGGKSNASVTGCIIQEQDQDKNVVFEWNSFDHYNILDAVHEDLTERSIDYVHANAIELDSDGHILLSSRHLDEITKIDRNSGAIIWRLGGLNNQFTFVNDDTSSQQHAHSPFCYQHDIRRLENGNITIYDNGNYKDSSYTRIAEYELDEQNLIATLVWEYRSTPDRFCHFVGNAQRLPNGNTMSIWNGESFPTTITEIRPDCTKAFEMNFPEVIDNNGNKIGVFNYRAFRSEWQGRAVKPYLWKNFTYNSLSLNFVQFGDSSIVQYKIYQGLSEDSLYVIDSTSHNYLNLYGLSPGQKYYFQVSSINSDDNESPMSNMIDFRAISPQSIDIDEIVPDHYILHQNHPNPFNPVTTIQYDLRENSRINLNVYDLLGRKVRELVNDYQPAGTKSVIWNGTNDQGAAVSAGVYLFQIQAGEFVQTKKMVLLK
jgi:hypothetical protein